MNTALLISMIAGFAFANDIQECSQNGALGMISGDIQDWQITASSNYPEDWDPGCAVRHSRLYLRNGLGWCAKYKSSSEWIQVDLGVMAKVTGVMTQGRGDGKEWVKAFMVSYSTNAVHWRYVTDQYNNERVFEGNTDSYSVKHSYLETPITARFIKFHTIHWHKHPSMRIEIVGCQACREKLGLPPYSQISASSSKKFRKGSSCKAEDGYIITNKAWCARRSNDKQWLQFDLGPPTLVTGLVTKGRGDRKKRHWVTSYKLSYSNDSVTWQYYKDKSHLQPKLQWHLTNNDPSSQRMAARLQPNHVSSEDGVSLVFGANVDKSTERYHYLNAPFAARFVRFHPVTWNKRISMRAGLFGCPYKVPTKQETCGKGFMQVNKDTPCVENVAYNKESWINNRRHVKRHIRNRWTHGHASRAVDGDTNNTFDSCTVLNNHYVEKPIWMVDLNVQRTVSGVVIVTWQGEGSDKDYQTYLDDLGNLDKLAVYVDRRAARRGRQPKNLCGFISRKNDALFKASLYVHCKEPLKGRYLYIEAWGIQKRYRNKFNAILCEVMVHA